MTSEPSSHSIAATRSSLLRRIGDPGDAQSWAEFYGIYRKLVQGFAVRLGLNPADAEELTQDVFNEVAQNISKFQANPARGSFRGWLLNLTRWRVTDRLRRQQRAAGLVAPHASNGDPDRTCTIERIADPSGSPDVEWEREWEHRVVEAALERIARRVDARHFQVFELHVVQGWELGRIARHLEINRATVYVIHYRLKKLLQTEVTQLREQLG